MRGGILDEAKRPSVERVPEDPRFRNERVRALEPTRSVYQVAILRRLRAQQAAQRRRKLLHASARRMRGTERSLEDSD